MHWSIIKYVHNNKHSDHCPIPRKHQHLSGINHAKKKRIAEGDTAFSKEQLDSYSKRYDEILKCGYEQNKKTKGKYAKSEEKKLLNRLKKYKKNHLLFAYKFEVEYSNNMSDGLGVVIPPPG